MGDTYIAYIDLQLEIRLGSGAFGEVRRAIWHHTVVAVKVLHKGDDKAMAMFLKEAVLLCKMHHPCKSYYHYHHSHALICKC